MRITLVLLFACSVFAQSTSNSDLSLPTVPAKGATAEDGVQSANKTVDIKTDKPNAAPSESLEQNATNINDTVSDKSSSGTVSNKSSSGTLGAASIDVGNHTETLARLVPPPSRDNQPDPPSSSSDDKNSTDTSLDPEADNLKAASIDKPSFVAAIANRTGPSGKGLNTTAQDNGTLKGSSVTDPRKDDRNSPKSKGSSDSKGPTSKAPSDSKGPTSKGPSDSKGPSNSKDPNNSKGPSNSKGPNNRSTNLNGCRNFCRRREIRNLSPDERLAFFSAVKRIMNGASPTQYDGMVKWHIDAQQFAHSTAYFLPWHRAYVREFELALQDIDSGICVPYWNWSVDSQAPELSPIMTDDFYGGNGGTDGCVIDGHFNGWNPYYPQPHCLTRSYIYGDKLGAYHSIEGINRIVTSSSDYDTFRNRLETLAHPSVHNSIGGDISKMWSPNDPLFFAHHGYVDYIWTQWQSRHGKSFGGSGFKGGNANIGDPLQYLPAGKYTVKNVLSTSDLCYQYLDMDNSALGDTTLPPPSVQAPPKSKMPDRVNVVKLPEGENRFSSKDRSNLNIVRFPDPAPEEWLRNNGHDVAKVRGYESDYKSMYTNLNRIQGYISPCALWNRPSLTKHIITAKTPVYADVNGYGRVEVDYAQEAADPFQAMSDIKVKVQMCSPDVELPPEACNSDLEKLVGKSAFAGAGALRTVSDMSDVSAESKYSAAHGGWLITSAAMLLLHFY